MWRIVDFSKPQKPHKIIDHLFYTQSQQERARWMAVLLARARLKPKKRTG